MVLVLPEQLKFKTANLSLILYSFQLPVSMEEVMDLLNDVNQQLGESGEAVHRLDGLPMTSSPRSLTDPAVAASHKLSMSSPVKSVLSPSKRPVVCLSLICFSLYVDFRVLVVVDTCI